MNVDTAKIIELPKITDARGNLTFLETGRHTPFEFKRAYYLYDVPEGATRAGHALKTTQQMMIAVSGSFDVLLDDGVKERRITLNHAYQGLYIPPMLWRWLDNFTSGAVCLCLVSTFYDPGDYYRDHGDFKAAVDRLRAETAET